MQKISDNNSETQIKKSSKDDLIIKQKSLVDVEKTEDKVI